MGKGTAGHAYLQECGMPTLIGNLYNIEGKRPKKVATFRLVRGEVKVRLLANFPEAEIVKAVGDWANTYLKKLLEHGGEPEDYLRDLQDGIGVELIFRKGLRGRFFWTGAILEPDLRFEEVKDSEGEPGNG